MTFRTFLLTAVTALFLAACGGTDETTTDTDTAADLDITLTDEAVDDTVNDDLLPDTATDDVVPDEDAALAITRHAMIETTLGTITIGLYGDAMPVTAGNFESYIEEDFFTGLIFHRVIAGFMIQGGGYDEAFAEKEPHDPIDFERSTVVKHVKYAISMARTNNIDSATSQFFITLDAQPHLDYTSDDDFISTSKFPCAAFGIVTDGFDVVDAIGAVQTGTQTTPLGDLTDVPVTPVIITATSFAD